jgi:serine phosphatase RsbU (regulator of sigma subunit)
MLRQTRYVNTHDRLEVGDIVVLMTDGVLEAIESDLVKMHAVAGLLAEAPEGTEAVNRAIFAEVDRRGRRTKADDRTVLSIERSAPRFDATLPRRVSS